MMKSFEEQAEQIKAKNKKDYRDQVKAYKKKKYGKHSKSKLRHPFRAIHRNNQRIEAKTDSYWKQGQQYAEDRINKKPQYYYGDRDAVKGISKELGLAKSVVLICVIVIVMCFAVYGFVSENF